MDKFDINPTAVYYDCLNTLIFASRALKDLSERLSGLEKLDPKLFELYQGVASHASFSSISLEFLFTYGLPKSDCKENLGCKK